ncbi:MAG: DUF475 domain-containing protein [Synechococcaceae cyanobacterium RM1_1_27]|nr:DUF475 domain-containing protein [Synechococcaceae cyanobacterium SM2_3_2]NJO86132.1 DUF475 domain-containing protein [Synechococcaceae cyanobacterium RM1_1_27]
MIETLQTIAQGVIASLSWTDLVVIAALVLLEAALSADNAVALAALVKHLPNQQEQNRALRWGMVGAFGFRILIVLTATWLLDYWPAKVIGAAYLLWLAFQHFRQDDDDEENRIPSSANFWQTILLVEMTDLVFSFDSIAASIAVSPKAWVIITGGILGIILMRYMASFFLRWLDEFGRLEDAAYFMIAIVGGRMMFNVLLPDLEIPEWVMLVVIVGAFVWGFSQRRDPKVVTAQTAQTAQTVDCYPSLDLQEAASIHDSSVCESGELSSTEAVEVK